MSKVKKIKFGQNYYLDVPEGVYWDETTGVIFVLENRQEIPRYGFNRETGEIIETLIPQYTFFNSWKEDDFSRPIVVGCIKDIKYIGEYW